MRSTTSLENPAGFIGNLARALVIGLLASVLTLVPAAQEAKATGAIAHNDGTCDLTWNFEEGIPTYEISNAESLWEITDCSANTDASGSPVAGHFLLTDNIDVSQPTTAPTGSPIGFASSSDIRPFIGILDGGNRQISGLDMSSTTAGVGLFALLQNATVKNLVLSGSFSTSSNVFGGGSLAIRSTGDLTISNVATDVSVYAAGAENVGGLVGRVERVDVTSFQGSGTVSAQAMGAIAGGIIGRVESNATVIDSQNNAVVSGANFVGGFFGQVWGDVRTFISVNNGNVTGGSNVGGLVGLLEGAAEFVETDNRGDISGESYVGGLAGFVSSSALVERVYNQAASVIGIDRVGGLIGEVQGPLTINSSQNEAAIGTTGGRVGGLVGVAASSSNLLLANNFTSGAVFGALDRVGGLIGEGIGKIAASFSYNTGPVTGNNDVGGLFGAADVVELFASNNFGNVAGQHRVGGLLGSSTQSSITASNNLSTISSAVGTSVGGLAGESVRISVYASRNFEPVSGENIVGGLLGFVLDEATIEESFNLGAVTAVSTFAGGLVGVSQVAELRNTFNTGAIYGNASVGGLIGRAVTSAAINLSYNSGNVGVGGGYNNPVGDVDGLVGDSRSNVIISSVMSNVDSRYVSTLTTLELQRASTFTGFDFTNTWGFGSCSDNGGFPMLRVFEDVDVIDYNSVGCGYVPPAPTTQTSQAGASAYSGPTLEAIQPRGVIGSELVLTGQRLNSVTSIRIGGVLQVITSATERSLMFTVAPETKLGSNDIVLVSSFGTITLQSAIQIESPSTSVSSATKSALIGKTRLLSENAAVNQSWFAANLKDSGIVRIACTVLVSPNATHHQRVQARKQASRVCAQAAGHLESANVWFQTRETTRSRMPGRALITFRG